VLRNGAQSYVYVSLATGTAYSELFLVYVALVSASFIAFVLLLQALRRNPRGYLLAWVMLAFLVFISIGVALQTAFQVSAGVDFAPAEIYLSPPMGMSGGEVPPSGL